MTNDYKHKTELYRKLEQMPEQFGRGERDLSVTDLAPLFIHSYVTTPTDLAAYLRVDPLTIRRALQDAGTKKLLSNRIWLIGPNEARGLIQAMLGKEERGSR